MQPYEDADANAMNTVDNAETPNIMENAVEHNSTHTDTTAQRANTAAPRSDDTTACETSFSEGSQSTSAQRRTRSNVQRAWHGTEDAKQGLT